MCTTYFPVQITSEERLMEAPPFLRAPVKKACPNFFNCRDGSPEHRNAFIHACLYGQSCRDIQNPHHTSMYYHYNKPLCNGTNCNITDPFHRKEYHHPRMWDYLECCKYNKGCTYAKDFNHCQRYHHLDYDIYPEIPNELKWFSKLKFKYPALKTQTEHNTYSFQFNHNAFPIQIKILI